MTTSLRTPLEKSRKAHSLLLQVISQDIKQTAMAADMGVSESTVSRIISKDLASVLDVIYLSGYKIVGMDERTVDSATLDAMTLITSKAMSNPRIARQVMSGEAE